MEVDWPRSHTHTHTHLLITGFNKWLIETDLTKNVGLTKLPVQVKLMRQLQEEAQKSRLSEQKNRKTIAQLQKQQRAKETRIQNLEADKNKKELILKRKMEEVMSVWYITLVVVIFVVTVFQLLR